MLITMLHTHEFCEMNTIWFQIKKWFLLHLILGTLWLMLPTLEAPAPIPYLCFKTFACEVSKRIPVYSCVLPYIAPRVAMPQKLWQVMTSGDSYRKMSESVPFSRRNPNLCPKIAPIRGVFENCPNINNSWVLCFLYLIYGKHHMRLSRFAC